MVERWNFRFPLRLALAMHLQQCGELGAYMLKQLRLDEFLVERLSCAPWYGHYVNQFLVRMRMPRSEWTRALAHTMRGYPMMLMSMLLYAKMTNARDSSMDSLVLNRHIVLPSHDVEEFGALLRLQHSFFFRRFEYEFLVMRELRLLIAELQRHHGLDERHIEAYVKRFCLYETHSWRFHQLIRLPMKKSQWDITDPDESIDVRHALLASDLVQVCVKARDTLKNIYGRSRNGDNLTPSIPSVFARMGACSSSEVALVTVDLCTILQWFAAAGRWAVCAHLVLFDDPRLAFRAFPLSRQLALFKTVARMETALGERCIDRWLVAPSPLHSGECMLIGTEQFWHRFAVQQSYIYLNSSSLPGLLRSRHADMFQMVRALLCGDDFTVLNMFTNVLIAYMNRASGSDVPFSVARGRVDYFRYLPTFLFRVFGSVDNMLDEFYDSALYVPRDETIIDRNDHWVGLPMKWSTVHTIEKHAHRPHFYYGLLSYLSVHRTRYIHCRLLEEVNTALREGGFFVNRRKIGYDLCCQPFDPNGRCGRFYNHIDNWIEERRRIAEHSQQAWIPLTDDDIDYYFKLHEDDAHMRIDECWYQLCCDSAALPYDLRMRMFMCVRIDCDIWFPSTHHNMLATDCQAPVEWIRAMIESAAFGHSTEQLVSGADEMRIRYMHSYFLEQSLDSPGIYEKTPWHPRHMRILPIYNRTTLEFLVTLTCLLRDGMTRDVPPPHIRDTCPYGTLEGMIAHQGAQKHERETVERERFEQLTSGTETSRFTAIEASRSNKNLAWARKFGVMFMEELRRLLNVVTTRPPCAMAYNSSVSPMMYVGSQVIMLLNEDIGEYTTHYESPLNTPDTRLMMEASMFTHYQRNSMRRRLERALTAEEYVVYDSQIQYNHRETPEDHDDAPYDPLDDVTPLFDVVPMRGYWFFYSMWKDENGVFGTPEQRKLRGALMRTLTLADLSRCMCVCRRWYIDLNPLVAGAKQSAL
jgi:hypothetical protein